MNIALIPARGGSKGILKKNIIDLRGKPLLWYTIHAALNSKLIDEVYITTDDNEIAKISSKYCNNIIKRPEELAKDDSPTLPVLLHALETIEKIDQVNKIVVLQPTSPLRQSFHIDEAICSYNKEYSSVVSVCVADHSPYKMYSFDDGHLKDFISKKWRGKPRQSIPEVYRETGAIYVTTIETLKSGSIIGDNPKPYIMQYEDSIDIDNKNDLLIAEMFLRERLKK